VVVRFGNAQDFEHFASDEGYPGKFVRDVMVALGKAKEQKGVVREEMMVPPPPPFAKEAVLSLFCRRSGMRRWKWRRGRRGGY
jgi:hypothetical protein